MKKMLFIVILFLLSTDVRSQDIYEIWNFTVSRQEIPNQPTTFPHWLNHFFTSGHGNGGYIGTWKGAGGETNIGGCSFTVFRLPQKVNYNGQPVDYRVISATITVTTTSISGYTYQAGLLSPESLIIHDSPYDYNDSEALYNKNVIIGNCNETAPYGTEKTFTIYNPVPGELIAVGARGDDTKTLSYPNTASCGFYLSWNIELILPLNISVINSFPGGYVKAGIDNSNPPSISAGSVQGCISGKTLYIAPDLERNNTENYNYVFRKWSKSNSFGNLDVEEYYSPLKSTFLTNQMEGDNYEALMKKQYDVNISLVSAMGNIPGNIIVNGTNMVMPGYMSLYEDTGTSVTLSLPNTSISIGQGVWLDYTFDHWIVDGAFYSSAASITVNNIDKHKSILAYYRSTPNNGYRNLRDSSGVGQPILIKWNEHPSAGVSHYQIWRRVRHLGVTGADVLVATVNRGTTTYTDYDYTYTSGYSDDMIWYDIRAYFEPDGIYANSEFLSVFGKAVPIDPTIHINEDISAIQDISIEFKLGAYPNPFNPATVIRYQLPEAGFVSIKVYNLLSQEVASLVEEVKGAGIHTVNFNAGNLPSGIYIARIQAGSKVMSRKLQLIK